MKIGMMFDVEITERIKEHCVNEVKKYNFGKRGHSNGTPEQQLRGIVAQSVVQDACGFPLGTFGVANVHILSKCSSLS